MKTIKSWKEIPYSDEANQVISDLKAKQLLIVRVKNVKGTDSNFPKVQIEFAEKINNNNETNALAMFNTKDTRFSSGAQRVWITADIADAERIIGKEFIDELEKEPSVEVLNIMQPQNGQELRIKVQEVPESQLTDNEKEYIDNYLKRAGAEGNYFFTPSGERVATRRTLVGVPVGSDPTHEYLEGSYREEATSSVMTGSNSPALSSDMQGA